MEHLLKNAEERRSNEDGMSPCCGVVAGLPMELSALIDQCSPSLCYEERRVSA